MEDFSKPYQAPNPKPTPTGPEAVQPGAPDAFTFQRLTFGDKFSTSFRLSLRYFISYLPLLLTAGFISCLTLGFLGPACMVGLSTSVLRQIDGGPEKPTFGELFSPFNRLGVMLLLALIMWGFLVAYFVVLLIMSFLSVIPVVGIFIAFAVMALQFAVQVVLTIIMAVVAFYLAEYDDTAVNAVSTGFNLMKNHIGTWLGGFLCVLIIQIPMTILATGFLLIPFVPLVIASASDFRPDVQFSAGMVIMLVLGILVMLVGSLFLWLFSLFAYGLSYRQCVSSGQPAPAPAPTPALNADIQ